MIRVVACPVPITDASIAGYDGALLAQSRTEVVFTITCFDVGQSSLAVMFAATRTSDRDAVGNGRTHDTWKD